MKIHSRKESHTKDINQNLFYARDSVIYFALNYLNLRDEYTNEEITLTEEQLQLLFTLQTGNITATKGARQLGKSLVFAIFVAWKAIFADHENIFFINNHASNAQIMCTRVQSLIKQAGFLSHIYSHGRDKLGMINGTKIHFISANKLVNATKGHPVNMILADEMAFFNIPAQDLLDQIAFFRVVQQAKLHVISTPSLNTACAFKRFYEAVELSNNVGGVIATSLSHKCPFRKNPNYVEEMKALLPENTFNSEILGNFVN